MMTKRPLDYIALIIPILTILNWVSCVSYADAITALSIMLLMITLAGYDGE
jgi:hypothetical protein